MTETMTKMMTEKKKWKGYYVLKDRNREYALIWANVKMLKKLSDSKDDHNPPEDRDWFYKAPSKDENKELEQYRT